MNPPCDKCIHYKPGPYVRTGVCTKYVAYRGRGKLVYEFSDTVRMDASRCGPDGKMFLSAQDVFLSKHAKEHDVFLWSLFNDDE